MNKSAALRSTMVATMVATLVAANLMFAASVAAAAVVADDDEPGDHANNESPAVSVVAGLPQTSPNRWVVRLEGGAVAMRDNWLGVPGSEIGLTVGRDLTRSWSVELTGSARDADNEIRRSWSALAAARWVAVSSANGRHGLTLAGGPFVEVDHVVHGTMPFAHAELAYVYRAPFGLTVLAGLGPNFALASSSYVAPPRTPCEDSGGDAIVFCLDFGPDAQEIHAGDAIGQMRLAVGWLF